jgi:hypothetical protein
MQSNHMDRMHMWSSFNILIEDLWLSSNVAVTVTKNRKLLSTKYFKIRYKASCHQTWWKWCIYDPLPDLWLLTLIVYEKWLLSLLNNYFFFDSLKIVKSQCCYQTIKEQCIYNSLLDHKWWPRLPSNMAVAASQTWKLVEKNQ